MSLFEQDSIRKLLGGSDLAIDLGTANTRLFSNGGKLYVEEPTMVATEPQTGEITAVGIEAERISGKDCQPGPRSPLKSGVVSDVEAASILLRHLMGRVRPSLPRNLVRPRALACIPTDACEEEREKLIEATLQAGASRVVLVREPLAAAVGAGLDISAPHARMLVDIGDGVTDIAVIRSSELISTAAIRCACSDLQRAVSRMVSREQGIFLYPREAQRLSHRVGAIREINQTEPESAQESLYAEGRELSTGISVGTRVSLEAISQAMEPVLNRIISEITRVVHNLPDEIACEIIESGIWLTGGGAKLLGIPERLQLATSIDVRVASDPMRAVILGAQQMLEVSSATKIWNN